jgi:glycosyltransferase involved in cell wall biosynthesis
VVVPLVCTGKKTPFFPEIETSIRQHGLSDQVQFMGYLEESEIKALYALCTAVVVPTRFESVSFPVWEAFQAAKPVACSTATALPGQVGPAGLLFGPDDVPAMAEAIRTLWSDAGLRTDLSRRGSARLAEFSLDRMALHMRALYRKLAGSMDERDCAILAAGPLI